MSFAFNAVGDDHPEEYASIISKFLVLWITPLIELANKRKLEAKDIPDAPKDKNVDHDDKPSSSLSDLFNKFIYNVSTITNERM